MHVSRRQRVNLLVALSRRPRDCERYLAIVKAVNAPTNASPTLSPVGHLVFVADLRPLPQLMPQSTPRFLMEAVSAAAP